MSRVQITARVSSSVHQEVLEFVVSEGSLFDLAAVNKLIVDRACERPGVEGDATGSDYFGLTAPVTSFEVLATAPVGGASGADAPLPPAPGTPSEADSQPASPQPAIVAPEASEPTS